jgi:hypothetical protein
LILSSVDQLSRLPILAHHDPVCEQFHHDAHDLLLLTVLALPLVAVVAVVVLPLMLIPLTY